jgi:hypothetical protein
MSFLAGRAAEWVADLGAQVRRLDPPLWQPYGLAYVPGELTPVGQALAELASNPDRAVTPQLDPEKAAHGVT